MSRIVRASTPASLLVLMASETLLLFASYTLAALWNPATLDLGFYLLDDGGLRQIALVVAIIQLGLYFQLLYDTLIPRSRILLVQQFAVVLGSAFLLQSLADYTRSELQLPRWTMMYGSLIALAALTLWRIAYVSLVSNTIPVKRLLFMGRSFLVPEIMSLVDENPDLGLSVVGHFDSAPRGAVAEPPSHVDHAELVERMDATLRTQRPDRIVTARGEHDRLPTRLLLDVQLTGVQIEDAAQLYETLTGRIPVRSLTPSDLILSSIFDPSKFQNPLQSVLTLVSGLMLTVAVSPVLAVCAVLIRLTSPGPVLLRCKRVGLGGVIFDLYRFRVSPVTPAAGGDGFTRVGRWLRRLKLDGLPLLLNVLRGNLSLVGPEPERPEFAAVLDRHIPFYALRHSIRPGISGWAQINQKHSSTLRSGIEKLEFDLYYLKNGSYTLDLYILLHSLPFI